MKVLHLSPLWFPVEKNAPGGIESFLAQLIAPLQRRGCDITLIATADSATSATLVSAAPLHLVGAMRESKAFEYSYYEQHQLHLAIQIAAKFDVVHSHIGPSGYVLSSLPHIRERVLHTIHTPVTPDMAWFFGRHPDRWVSTVSAYQAGKLQPFRPHGCAVIPNGIATAEFPWREHGGESLVYIGRMEGDKGPDLAVRTAQALDRPLNLAGPIVDADFFQRTIEPHLDRRIRYLGIADHLEKVELFGEAACAVLPFRREEPFGLVAIEAMACGTPVVTLARGALPEVVEPGVTGYLADDEDALVPAVIDAMKLDRRRVRERVVARFDIEGVADQYHQVYQRIARREQMFAQGNAVAERA